MRTSAGHRHSGASPAIGTATLFGATTPIAELPLGLSDRLQHDHAPGDPAGEPHGHRHRQSVLVHTHPHSPALHHSHEKA